MRWLILAVLFSGCASTRGTSLKSPGFSGRTFGRVMVSASGVGDLAMRGRIEDVVVQRLARRGVPAWRAVDSWAVDASEDEKRAAVQLRLADSALVIVLAGSGAEPVQITSPTYETKASGDALVARYNPGVTGVRPYASFVAQLQDLSSGRVAWVYQATTGGSVLANFGTVTDSFANELVDEMIGDGMIHGPQ